MVPKSIFEAFSTNEILQIVVFSVIFGIALGAYGEKGQMVTDFLDKIAHVVLIMVNYVMWFAPLEYWEPLQQPLQNTVSKYLPFMPITYWHSFWVLQHYGLYYLELVIWY